MLQGVIFNYCLYTVKKFIIYIGTINSSRMTNIVIPKNPNPNILLIYNNMPVSGNLMFSINAVFKYYDREGI